MTWQEVSVAWLLNADASSHLTNNQLDVLVVNRHTLVAINPLHFFNEILLCLTNTFDLHQFFWIQWAVSDAVARFNILSIFYKWTTAGWQNDFELCALIIDELDWNTLALVFENSDNSSYWHKSSRTFWIACFEEFNYSWQTTSDVFSCNTTCVEGTHGQLSTRLTD